MEELSPREQHTLMQFSILEYTNDGIDLQDIGDHN